MANCGLEQSLESSCFSYIEDCDPVLDAEELMEVEVHPTIAAHLLQVHIHRLSGRLFIDELAARENRAKSFEKDTRDFGDWLLKPANDLEYKKMRVCDYLKAVRQSRSLNKWRSCAIGKRWWVDANEVCRDLFWSWFRREEQCDELRVMLKEIFSKYTDWAHVVFFMNHASEALERREVGVFYACMNRFPNELLQDVYYTLRRLDREKFVLVFPLSWNKIVAKTQQQSEIMRRNIAHVLGYFHIFCIKSVKVVTSCPSASKPIKEVWPFDYCMWSLFNQSIDKTPV